MQPAALLYVLSSPATLLYVNCTVVLSLHICMLAAYLPNPVYDNLYTLLEVIPTVHEQRSEYFHYYKMFTSFSQTHTGKKIKVLRSDRGNLNDSGTQHKLTAAHTPQQNGGTERLNRTLINLVRCMIANKPLSKRFWAEALANAVYVRNRFTSSALPSNTTPHHKWMRNAPNLSHVRVCGSEYWYTLPKNKVKKLDTRAREAMFLGYAEVSKAYKLWDSELQKVVISRDVTFDESKNGACGNVGDGSVLVTDEDFVSLDITTEIETSSDATSHQPARRDQSASPPPRRENRPPRR